MKILDIKPKRAKRPGMQPKVFFDVFGLDFIMVDTGKKLHPAAESVRQEIFTRFLHNASSSISYDQSLVVISQKLHDDFQSWPTDYLIETVKKIHLTATSILNEYGVFGWLLYELRRGAGLTDGKSLDDAVFDAAISRLQGRLNQHNPIIMKIVEALPETTLNKVRAALEGEPSCQDADSRSFNTSRSDTIRSEDVSSVIGYTA